MKFLDNIFYAIAAWFQKSPKEPKRKIDLHTFDLVSNPGMSITESLDSMLAGARINQSRELEKARAANDKIIREMRDNASETIRKARAEADAMILRNKLDASRKYKEVLRKNKENKEAKTQEYREAAKKKVSSNLKSKGITKISNDKMVTMIENEVRAIKQRLKEKQKEERNKRRGTGRGPG